MRCEKCGRILEYRIEGSVQGQFCEECGWGAVTTFIPPIRRDPTTYQVFVLKNDHPTVDQIKIVSKICNRNYLEVRRMMVEQQALIYEGCAETVLTVIESLNKGCLQYKVFPQFPYSSVQCVL